MRLVSVADELHVDDLLAVHDGTNCVALSLGASLPVAADVGFQPPFAVSVSPL